MAECVRHRQRLRRRALHCVVARARSSLDRLQVALDVQAHDVVAFVSCLSKDHVARVVVDIWAWGAFSSLLLFVPECILLSCPKGILRDLLLRQG